MFLILLYLRLNFELTTFFQVYLLESCRTELEAEQKRHKEFADHELRQRLAYAQLQRQVATTHLKVINRGLAQTEVSLVPFPFFLLPFHP